jgi:hypothetical protein
MRPIPMQSRNEMSKDPFMQKCCLPGPHGGRIEFHHPFIYAGRQIVDRWATVPACEGHHILAKSDSDIKDGFKRVALSRATDEDLMKYNKFNWTQEKGRLGIV